MDLGTSLRFPHNHITAMSTLIALIYLSEPKSRLAEPKGRGSYSHRATCRVKSETPIATRETSKREARRDEIEFWRADTETCRAQ